MNDDVEFVSSNPVNKTQSPAASLPLPLPPPMEPQTPTTWPTNMDLTPKTTTQPIHDRNISYTGQGAKDHPFPGAIPNFRETNLFTASPSHPARLSEAISPKQMPAPMEPLYDFGQPYHQANMERSGDMRDGMSFTQLLDSDYPDESLVLPAQIPPHGDTVMAASMDVSAIKSAPFVGSVAPGPMSTTGLPVDHTIALPRETPPIFGQAYGPTSSNTPPAASSYGVQYGSDACGAQFFQHPHRADGGTDLVCLNAYYGGHGVHCAGHGSEFGGANLDGQNSAAVPPFTPIFTNSWSEWIGDHTPGPSRDLDPVVPCGACDKGHRLIMQHHIDNVKWDHNMSQQSQQESFANCAAPQAYEQQGADYQGGPSRQGVSIGGADEDPFTSSPPGPLYPDPELFAATGLTPGPVSNNFAPPSPVPASSDDCAPKSSPQPAKGVVPGMYAQNLYLDLAYTIEEMCPYQDIAARHNTTPAKVEKALKTIILLPMLRNITDKRRTGPLAQERKKDFQHATKAWKTEKAQDAVVRRNGGTLQRTQANESSESYEGKGKGRAATEPSAFELARFLPPLDIGDPFQDSDGDD